jgi:hypothetical protein
MRAFRQAGVVFVLAEDSQPIFRFAEERAPTVADEAGQDVAVCAGSDIVSQDA